jgi:MULE transposase domain
MERQSPNLSPTNAPVLDHSCHPLSNLYAKVSHLREELSTKWVAELPFDLTDSYGIRHDGCNILAFLSDMYKGQRFYFDIVKYANSENGEKALIKDLQITAFENGFNMIVKSRKQEITFICQCGKPYHNNNKENDNAVAVTEFRKDRLHANKKNNRNNGKKLPRRQVSIRPLDSCLTCKFRFTVGLDDEKGFYINGGVGCAQHTNHIKLNPKQCTQRLSHLETLEKDVVDSINSAKALHSVARNVYHQRTGKHISRQQVFYMNQLAKQLKETAQELTGSAVGVYDSAPDRLFHFFDEQGFSYCRLFEEAKGISAGVVSGIEGARVASGIIDGVASGIVDGVASGISGISDGVVVSRIGDRMVSVVGGAGVASDVIDAGMSDILIGGAGAASGIVEGSSLSGISDRVVVSRIGHSMVSVVGGVGVASDIGEAGMSDVLVGGAGVSSGIVEGSRLSGISDGVVVSRIGDRMVSVIGGVGVASDIGEAGVSDILVGGDGVASDIVEGSRLLGICDGVVVSRIGDKMESVLGGAGVASDVGEAGVSDVLVGGVGAASGIVEGSRLLFETSGELVSTAGTVLLPSKENEELHQFASEHRSGLAITNDQKLFIAAAWVSKQELRQFLLNPEVLHIDATADTNKEKYPLITITGRDMASTMFTVMRAFVPNERAWVFRWLFSVAMPQLLGPQAIKRIKLIITDGDSQETSQLDVALKEHFSGAVRGRCGWHIIDRGWTTKGPKVTHATCSPSEFRSYAALFKAWLYSWMSPAVHTKEEYNTVYRRLYSIST